MVGRGHAVIAVEVRHVPTVLAHRFCCSAEPAAPADYLPTFLRNRYGAAAAAHAVAGGRPPWRLHVRQPDASFP